jgi:hypothetical protein
MTISQLTLICAGISLNALTFVLGIMVGVSLANRKDSTHDSVNEGTKGKDYWHDVERRPTQVRFASRGPGCTGTRPEARAD